MVLERIRPFRLVERGRAGLARDADGIGLGGVALASVEPSARSARRYVVRPAGELGAILGAAYGPQQDAVIQRCHRGLRRAASALEAEDLALTGIEAVMLALPELNAEAMAKLARFADLEKGGDSWDDEPRLPVGQPGGGRWTTSGAAGASAPRPQPRPSARRRRNGTTANAPPGRLPPRNTNAPKPRGPGGPVSRVPGTPPERPTQPKTPSADPVAALVDASNSVASTLVDAASWLQQPATHVPIAPEIAAGEPDFPMGTAWVEATDPTAFRDARPVSHLEVAADAVGAVGAVIPAARAIAEAPEAAPVMRFSSLSQLRRYLGPAGQGYQWHHIVEQTPGNLKRFGPEAIHSTDNVIRVPTSVHVGKGSISADYSSTPAVLNGLTVREWLSTQSFQAQRDYAIRMLKRYGQWK